MDYRKMFIVGIIHLGVGITFLTTISKPVGMALLTFGAILMFIGAKNKKEWKK